MDRPSRDAYDVVVIGSGLGGLSAAAFLADSGQTPLVLERLDHPGGYAAGFRRGEYHFDPAVHMIGVGEDMMLSRILGFLGVGDLCTFQNTGAIYEAQFPGASVRAGVGREAYAEGLAAPLGITDHSEIYAFLDLCQTMHEETHALPPALSLKELEDAVARFPTLFKYRSATLQDVLDECVSDDRLKAAIGAFWPIFGLPPSELSFFTTTTPITTFVEQGAYQVEGGTQALVDAMVTAIERRGGELVYGAEVERVLVEDGKVAGVALVGGDVIRSSVVVSNADIRRTFTDLVGAEHFPAPFLRKIGRMRPSTSAVVAFAATDLDLDGLTHTTFACEDWSHDVAMAEVRAGRPGGSWLSIPTLLDPSLAPDGEHVLVLTSLATGTPADIDAYVLQLVAQYANVLPGLRDRLTHFEVATPATLARYAGNADGAIYGWENSPANAGSRRLHHWTPLPGLFVCGHWTQPGSSAFRVIFSGVETMMTIRGAGYADQFLRALAN